MGKPASVRLDGCLSRAGSTPRRRSAAPLGSAVPDPRCPGSFSPDPFHHTQRRNGEPPLGTDGSSTIGLGPMASVHPLGMRPGVGGLRGHSRGGVDTAQHPGGWRIWVGVVRGDALRARGAIHLAVSPTSSRNAEGGPVGELSRGPVCRRIVVRPGDRGIGVSAHGHSRCTPACLDGRFCRLGNPPGQFPEIQHACVGGRLPLSAGPHVRGATGTAHPSDVHGPIRDFCGFFPEQLWPLVVDVTEIPPDGQVWSRLGMATFRRAWTEGQGVGAIRYCEFDTGLAREPVEAWEPPHRLKLRVETTPTPLKELSIYEHLHAPHLKGYYEVRSAEFELKPISGGTRLIGTTCYQHGLWPAEYWAWWCGLVVKDLQHRVLSQAKHRAEAQH